MSTVGEEKGRRPLNPTIAGNRSGLTVSDPPSRAPANKIITPTKAFPNEGTCRAASGIENVPVWKVALTEDTADEAIRPPNETPDTFSE